MSKNIMTRDDTGGGISKVAERLRELRSAGVHRREATVGAIDVDARTVELSFSSEIEYRRWWGVEVLDHSAGAVRLGRLNDNAAALWMHNWGDQRGVVVSGSARVDGDRKGRCTIRFSKSEKGDALFQDVIDGIVTKVSVGYEIHGIKLKEERESVDVYLVNDWEPYEISMVSVPADATVGVGRSVEKPQEEQRPDSQETANRGQVNSETRLSTEAKPNMKIVNMRDGAGNFVRAKVDESGNIVEVLEVLEKAGDGERSAMQRGGDTERARVKAITDMGREYEKPGLAMEYVASGKSPEDFQRALLHDFAAKRGSKPLEEQASDANIGMSDKEVRQFSLMRAIRAMADPQNAQFREAAAFEFEASRAAAERFGKNPKGIIIPNDVLSARTFSIGTAAGSGSGAGLVATELLTGSFIEVLRKRAWLLRRCRSMGGLVGNVDIPRQNASTAAYWVGEAGAPTGGQPGVDQISFTPKTLGATTDITRRLMMQSTPDAESFVRDDIIKIIGLEIDRVGIYGTGSQHQPKGVKNYTGINGKDFAAGSAPTFAELVAMETAIALDDADVNSMSYAFNATIRGHCKTTAKFGTGTESTIWEQGGTVNGYGVDVSNQIAAGDVFFGNWIDLVIALWGGLELTVDPYSLSATGGLRLVALQDIDLNVRHVESFCWGSADVA